MALPQAAACGGYVLIPGIWLRSECRCAQPNGELVKRGRKVGPGRGINISPSSSLIPRITNPISWRHVAPSSVFVRVLSPRLLNSAMLPRRWLGFRAETFGELSITSALAFNGLIPNYQIG